MFTMIKRYFGVRRRIVSTQPFFLPGIVLAGLVLIRLGVNKHIICHSSARSHPVEQTEGPVTKLLFKSNQLSERGTEVAIFDYALFAEKFFRVKSFFVFKKIASASALQKFNSYFPGRLFYPSEGATEEERSAFVFRIASEVRPDAFYSIEAGDTLSEVVPNTTNLVHAVFSCGFEHGDKYVAISEFVHRSGGQCQGIVPHMVWLPDDTVTSLRKELGIPDWALVLGWYGGHDSWDDKVTPLVLEIAAQRRDAVYFLFQNFKDESQLLLAENQNIISLPRNSNLIDKKRFILTCDAFLHTRTLGETFGLAVAEFSILQRPIITNRFPLHTFHLDVLQDDCYTYGSLSELRHLLQSLNKTNLLTRNFAAHYKDFHPRTVMDAFNEIFFNGSLVSYNKH